MYPWDSRNGPEQNHIATTAGFSPIASSSLHRPDTRETHPISTQKWLACVCVCVWEREREREREVLVERYRKWEKTKLRIKNVSLFVVEGFRVLIQMKNILLFYSFFFFGILFLVYIQNNIYKYTDERF